MEVWVDLPVVQWAYAHAQQYRSAEFPSSCQGLEAQYQCRPVRGPTGSILRIRPGHRATGSDADRQILMKFEDERALTVFLLRWT